MSEQTPDFGTILVLGATGYVGGRLVPRLLAAGYSVRAAGRSASKLACRPFAAHPRAEIVSCDVMDRASLVAAMKGCSVVFYLVHSMAPGGADFASRDREAAYNTARAAEAAGVSRIVYLGGLGENTEDLSEHLKSRMEVGRILREGKVDVTWFRAAIILGAGSASFEILRYLVDRLPVMVTPRWVRTQVQPIAITNVLEYLIGCLKSAGTKGQILDIGGPDILTYEELFRIYAEEAGLRKRLLIPVPVLTPTLSSYWISLVTPIPAALARPLTEGLRNRVVCRDRRVIDLVPTRLVPCREAIRSALERARQHQVETCWSDAGPLSPPEWVSCGDAPYAGGTVLRTGYAITFSGPPEAVWPSLITMGGEEGWPYGDFLWKVRGAIDRLLGGAGSTRGRRDPSVLRTGDALEFWRVLSIEEPRRILLLAEMKAPGEALLEFTLSPLDNSSTRLELKARFLPTGIAGMLYWYSLAPAHGLLFKGMLKSIALRSGLSVLQGPVPLENIPTGCTL
jgi:uncharacterized protein YbjT (DUF2867 family)